MSAQAASWDDLPEIPPELLAPQPVFASFWLWPTFVRHAIHQMPCLHMLLITRGGMRYRAWDSAGRMTTGTASKGTLFTFFPGREQYESDGDGPFNCYQICFTPARNELARGIPMAPGIGRLPQAIRVKEFFAQMVSACDRVIAALLARGPAWRLDASAGLLDLVRMAFLSAGGAKARPPERMGRWDKLMARLEEDPSPPSVHVLAREMSMSANHFIRAFREHVGTTPKQYIIVRRLWKAHAMLQDGCMVKEAALRCGFDDPLYFSRLYRRLFGAPPSRPAGGTALESPTAAAGLPICRHLWAPDHGPASVPPVG